MKWAELAIARLCWGQPETPNHNTAPRTMPMSPPPLHPVPPLECICPQAVRAKASTGGLPGQTQANASTRPLGPRGHSAPGKHWWHRRKSSLSSLFGSLLLEDNPPAGHSDLTNLSSSVAVVRCRATVRGVRSQCPPFLLAQFLSDTHIPNQPCGREFCCLGVNMGPLLRGCSDRSTGASWLLLALASNSQCCTQVHFLGFLRSSLKGYK